MTTEDRTAVYEECLRALRESNEIDDDAPRLMTVISDMRVQMAAKDNFIDSVKAIISQCGIDDIVNIDAESAVLYIRNLIEGTV